MEKEIKTGREMTLERGISNRKKDKQTEEGKNMKTREKSMECPKKNISFRN
jgi:hypothetical protein